MTSPWVAKMSEAIGVAEDTIETLLTTQDPDAFQKIALVSLMTVQRMEAEALKLKKEAKKYGPSR